MGESDYRRFRGEIKFSEILNMRNRHPHFVPRRNKGPAPFLAKHEVVTSAMQPEQVYHNSHTEDNLAQLMRRIEMIKHEKKDEPAKTRVRSEETIQIEKGQTVLSRCLLPTVHL